MEKIISVRGFMGPDPSIRNGDNEIRAGLDVEGEFSQEQKQKIPEPGPVFLPVADIITNAVPVKISLQVPDPETEPDC